MAQIIPGSIIGTYIATAATLTVAKNQNNRGFIPRILILTLKDEGSKGAQPKTQMFFEGETISAEELDVFSKYKAQQPDQQGGYPILLQALQASGKDWEFLQGWFKWPGGNCEDYYLRKGMCYGNNLDGTPSVKKDGTPVQTDRISVFTQVKYFTPLPDGSLKPTYYAGLGLEEQGRRMEDRFFKVPVETSTVDATISMIPGGGTTAIPGGAPGTAAVPGGVQTPGGTAAPGGVTGPF
jgi:hypothetical protein